MSGEGGERTCMMWGAREREHGGGGGGSRTIPRGPRTLSRGPRILWRHFPWHHFLWCYFLWRHFPWRHFPWRHLRGPLANRATMAPTGLCISELEPAL